MKKIIFIFLFQGIVQMLYSQQIERKIIIEKDLFYYTTIHPENQLATLHIGSLTQPLDAAKKYILPFGRNYNTPTNPLVWDIRDGFLYIQNVLENSQNDRNEAIKKMALSKITTAVVNDATPSTLIQQGADYPMYTINQPYVFEKKRTDYFSNYYFDAILFNQNYIELFANNDSLRYWTYNGKNWVSTPPFYLPLSTYFNLIHFNKKLYLHNAKSLYQITTKGLIKKTLTDKRLDVSKGIMIENRDNNSVRFIPENVLNKELPFHLVLKKYSLELLKK